MAGGRWANTEAALKKFMRLLNCKKCEQRPTDPVVIKCNHSFCYKCVRYDESCFICGEFIQPRDIRSDNSTEAIVSACDKIIDIIFFDRQNSSDEGQTDSERETPEVEDNKKTGKHFQPESDAETENEEYQKVEKRGKLKEKMQIKKQVPMESDKEIKTQEERKITETRKTRRQVQMESDENTDIDEPRKVTGNKKTRKQVQMESDENTENEEPRKIAKRKSVEGNRKTRKQLQIESDENTENEEPRKVEKRKSVEENRKTRNQVKKESDEVTEPEEHEIEKRRKIEEKKKSREQVHKKSDETTEFKEPQTVEKRKKVVESRQTKKQVQIESDEEPEKDEKHKEIEESETEEIVNKPEGYSKPDEETENEESDFENVKEFRKQSLLSSTRLSSTFINTRRRQAQKNMSDTIEGDMENIKEFRKESLLSSTIIPTTSGNTRRENTQKSKIDVTDDADDDTVKISESTELESLSNTSGSSSKKTKSAKRTSTRRRSSLSSDDSKIPKNIDKKNKKGETLLHQACIKKQEETVKYLLDHGANPNTKDNANWTPLQEAVSFGLYRICEMLLDKGALPNTPGIDNKTALHEAVKNNRVEETKLLLRYDANPYACDQSGKKPIDYCTSDEIRELLSPENLMNETRETVSNMSFSSSRSVGSKINKIVVLACNLKQSTKTALSLLAAKHKFKVLNTFLPSVTHVIVEKDRKDFLDYDLFLSILNGKWILSSEWIEIAENLANRDLTEMDLDIFEMKFLAGDEVPKRARLNAEMQNPKLFNNCYFFFALNSNDDYPLGEMSVSKEKLTKLCTEGGGTVLTREPNPEDITDRRIPFHIAEDEEHPLHNCSHYIIYVPGKDRIIYNMPHIKTLPLVWFIECIEKFTLVDPTLFGFI